MNANGRTFDHRKLSQQNANLMSAIDGKESSPLLAHKPSKKKGIERSVSRDFIDIGSSGRKIEKTSPEKKRSISDKRKKLVTPIPGRPYSI